MEKIDLGIAKDYFFQEIFEKRPFIFRGACSVNNIHWTDLDDAIYASQSSPLGITIHDNGGFVEGSEYSNICMDVGVIKKQLDTEKIFKLLDRGATIVFNRIESHSLKIRNICNQISDFVTENVVANGYVAFGKQESFGDHWDTHDVFAVQILGRKRWKIYAPTFPNPVFGQTSKDFKHCRPGDPILDIVLEAGDVLYVPRGWWHSATALNEPTFHVAVGIHNLKILDYVTWLAANVFREREALRASLRNHAIPVEFGPEVIEALVEIIVDPKNLSKFLNEQFGRRVDASGPNLKAYSASHSLPAAVISVK